MLGNHPLHSLSDLLYLFCVMKRVDFKGRNNDRGFYLMYLAYTPVLSSSKGIIP